MSFQLSAGALDTCLCDYPITFKQTADNRLMITGNKHDYLHVDFSDIAYISVYFNDSGTMALVDVIIDKTMVSYHLFKE